MGPGVAAALLAGVTALGLWLLPPAHGGGGAVAGPWLTGPLRGSAAAVWQAAGDGDGDAALEGVLGGGPLGLLRRQLLAWAGRAIAQHLGPQHRHRHEQQLQRPQRLAAAGGVPRDACVVGEGDGCRLANLPDDRWTRVFPGGDDTGCLDGSAYSFQAIRGDPDLVLIYFQSGGACWNQLTTNGIPGVLDTPVCYQRFYDQALTGAFRRDDPQNPFQNHTVIHINYCSGDAHLGNVTRDYNTPGGNVAVQRGYANARAAVDWLRGSGYDHALRSLTVMGTSAGSLAAQAWSGYLLKAFPAESASVIADSYVGVFPPGKQNTIVSSFGMCGLPIFNDDVQTRCSVGELTVEDVFFETMSHPDFAAVRFATVNSKADIMQRAFYIAADLLIPPMGSMLFDFPWVISGISYYSAMNRVLERYASRPNWSYFLINGEYHGYVCYDSWAESPFLGGPFAVGPSGPWPEWGAFVELREWCAANLDANGVAPQSVCEGRRAQPWEIWVTSFSQDYCDAM